MSSTNAILVTAQDIPNAQTTLYTSPATGKGTLIDNFSATNYSAGAQTFSVNLVPAAGSAGNSNLIIKTRSLGAAAVDMGAEVVGKYLAPGDKISMVASAATSINVQINGRELT